MKRPKTISHLLVYGTILLLLACRSPKTESIIASPAEVEKYLQIPSPIWEDQILYFIVTDRFFDGDPGNSDQGEGEYKVGDGGYWNGGDLRGITQKLGYIKDLGATGIWITPPVANQWRNPQLNGTGNHGYWASNFMELDKHMGSLEDYQQLSASLHKNKMYLIQDVVCNHLGDFYTYTGPYNPEDVSQNFKIHAVAQPTQYPFNHNDATSPEDRKMAIYHFTPNFYDHSDTVQKRLYQFADLDDLNTANPLVRHTLRASYNHWIKAAGVDGFRFDTPHMVEHDFWKDFIHSTDSAVPGVENFARSLGKEHFLTFGETAVRSLPFDDAGPREAAAYTGTPHSPEMTSILNFPLFSTIQWVFKEQKSTQLLTYYFQETTPLFEHPELLLNFIDNHDGARYLSQANRSSFRQALMFIMTIPGIPIIYYGTEQELPGTRQTMFRGGAGSPDQDHFITNNESFHFVRDLISMRKENRAFRRGGLKVLRDTPGGPGVFAYQLESDGQSILMLYNTANTEMLADQIPTTFAAGTLLECAYSLSGSQHGLVVGRNGAISTLLAPMEGMVLLETSKTKNLGPQNGDISIQELPQGPLRQKKLTLSGTARDLSRLSLMVDGNYARRREFKVLPDGSWSVGFPLTDLVNGRHRLTIFSELENSTNTIISESREFEIDQAAVLLAEYQDPIGDDNGPEGKYVYPKHISFSGQMDIEAVKVYALGTNLKIDVRMHNLTQIWLPPNGFDHALINIFIDLPGREGLRALPLQFAEMPEKAAWDYTVSVGGFGNAIFSREGASEDQLGRPVGPAAFVSGSPESQTITFIIAAAALDYPEDLAGTQIYLTTWDGSPGNPKGMSAEPQRWSPGGGNENDPRIMDDTELIQLTKRD